MDSTLQTLISGAAHLAVAALQPTGLHTVAYAAEVAQAAAEEKPAATTEEKKEEEAAPKEEEAPKVDYAAEAEKLRLENEALAAKLAAAEGSAKELGEKAAQLGETVAQTEAKNKLLTEVIDVTQQETRRLRSANKELTQNLHFTHDDKVVLSKDLKVVTKTKKELDTKLSTTTGERDTLVSQLRVSTLENKRTTGFLLAAEHECDRLNHTVQKRDQHIGALYNYNQQLINLFIAGAVGVGVFAYFKHRHNQEKRRKQLTIEL